MERKEKKRKVWALLVFFCQLDYGITHGSVLEMRMDKTQSVSASNYYKRPGDADASMSDESEEE